MKKKGLGLQMLNNDIRVALLLMLIFIVRPAFGGFSNELMISGKLTAWDTKNVYLRSRGVEFRVPRGFISDKIDLRPGKEVTLTMTLESFQKEVYPRKIRSKVITK